MPGPTPKRFEERRRRNIVPGETTVVMEGEVIAPALPASVRNPIARAWYESLKESGQTQYFEPSDWALAVVAAAALNKALRPAATAAMMGEAWKMMDALLTTEAARRKARLQVQRGVEEPADATPTAIDEYRKVLGG